MTVAWPRLCGLAALALLLVPGAAAETIRVEMVNLGFVPEQVTAHVGDTIEWVNRDFVAHTATGRKNQWDVTAPASGTGRVTIKVPGIVDYYCRFHPNMVGRISAIM